jgi:putative restriction endonuclease
MLKQPIRLIGGYGIYRGYETLTVSEAWSKFGPGNGVSSASELEERIVGFASKRSANFTPQSDPKIGCLSLDDPVFLEKPSYLDPAEFGVEFPRQVVKFKTFAEPDPFLVPLDRINHESEFVPIAGSAEPVMSQRKKRDGQAQFRRIVLDAYGNQCCISGTNVDAVIQAAHIQPYISKQSNHAQNGLPLRSDLHTLFDCGLISVGSGNVILISSRLDGTVYEGFRGKLLGLPKNGRVSPSVKALELHRQSVYRPD